jgi:hypothetical protein
VGVGVLIQISPQLRILVAIEAIDGRKGIDYCKSPRAIVGVPIEIFKCLER